MVCMLYDSPSRTPFLHTHTHTTQHRTMTLPGPSINTIKTRLSNAVSLKDPRAIASAVELPSLPKRIVGTTGSGGSASQQHAENLRIDGADWSNVLNPLLDAHLAIQSVRPPPLISRKLMHVNFISGVGRMLFQSKGLIQVLMCRRLCVSIVAT